MSSQPLNLALRPLADALLAAAAEDAGRVTAAAAQASAQALAQAREQAEEILREARRQGAADADTMRAAAQAGVRRQARGELLRAQREVYEQLRRQARLGAAQLRTRPEYARLRGHLAQAVWQALGGDASIYDADGGGIIGEIAGRRMDCSLASFADRAVEELAWELFDGEGGGVTRAAADRPDRVTVPRGGSTGSES